jgi:nitrilase
VSLGDSAEAVLMRGGSAMISLLDKVLAGPHVEGKTFLTATLDLGEIGRGKFDFDVAGQYSRPDVFQLHINEAPQHAVVAKTP